MAAGLQVFDQFGRLILDVSSRIPRVLGIQYIGGVDGSVTDAEFGNGTPFYSFQREATFPSARFGRAPSLSFAGNTLSWAYPPPALSGTITFSGWVVYGIY